VDLWKELEVGKEAPRIVHVVVVTPKDSANVCTYHHMKDIFELSHIVHTPFRPPGDLGFVPQTYSEGNAPLDAVVLSSAPNHPRTVIECRPVALLRMSVDGVRDDRVICVPVVDATMQKVQYWEQLNPHVMEDVQNFFESMFREQGRVLRVDSWLGAEEARRAIERAMNLYRRRFGVTESI